MSNVVGSGIARTLIDSDGDAVDDGAGKLNVNTTTKKLSTSTTSDKVSIGSTNTPIVDALSTREELVIVNDSDETIYLGIGSTAVVNEGIRLNANGGSFSTDSWTGSVNGICASGSKNVTVTELSP